MARLTTRKVYKDGGKVTAILEKELPEAKIGRYLGFKRGELELLFKSIKSRKIRVDTLKLLAYDSRAYDIPLSKLIKMHIEERERLR